MNLKIALVGNPNCGKTTMFNALTGSSQYVGNWPGVTVEKKSGKLKNHNDVEIIDLPGIYSLSPYTLEEVISRNYLLNEKPDVIINIVDSSNIERNLYLTTQLLEMGIPMILALNMTDIVRKRGDIINIKDLSERLDCDVIETAAVKSEGCTEVAEKAIALAKTRHKSKPLRIFSAEVTEALKQIEAIIKADKPMEHSDFYAIKLFERDEKAIEQLNLSESAMQKITAITETCEETMDDDSESIVTYERYQSIGRIVADTIKKKASTGMTTSDKIDRVVTNRFLALPIFAGVMFLMYFVSVSTVGAWVTGWANDVLFAQIITPGAENLLLSLGTAEWLNSLILNGIIGGVGAILGFVPQMFVLFFFLAILEDCGYMARVAFIMDRVFRKFGLSGKSFIPLLIGTGCSVPGIMASRTIENERDRKMTIMTTSFIPCSAKLPIIALIAGALFPGSVWVAPSAYFIGVTSIIISGIILKKTRGFSGDPAPFIMELPTYHVPGAKGVLIHMWERGKSFIKKAGTIIFVASITIWFLSSFNWTLTMVDTSNSILASIGKIIAPVFAPLGFGNWESTVAAITGLIAKETIVSTFGVLFGFAAVAADGSEIWPLLQQSFTQLSAFSFLVFNLLCAPCFAAIGAIHQEMGNGKWTLIAVGYQTAFAYTIALIIYQLGLFFTGGGFGFFTAVAILLILAMLYLLFRKPVVPSKTNKKQLTPVEEL
ncbi:ferrous iron transport protein B [Acetobacterium malicum]|uniref:Ferrous iron transport protein B n=1 Tax=Acetobacterium malicum TaxID=52692 RepID=A0ABR6YU89_9FIRM|nr:ferrous iron transport protein B [Acetobacterium malicum]MBC3898725.1 ferrous iron transport protein B [Acetobacterium malicum]